jgi:cellulose synthase/poly-beta-1,6-N-acetylglucosamine synthase-like glycosyltransferase
MAALPFLIANVITVIFLVVILSYYVFLLLPRRRRAPERFSRLTVIIPAHNEARYIGAAIESVLAAAFEGKKQVIVVDDGSRDRTAAIARRYPVTLLRQRHRGKSNALNLALRHATGELVAVVDGDSAIHQDALRYAVAGFNAPDVGAVCAVIKVKNRQTFLGMWLHLEQLYSSLTRSLLAKVNSNIVAAGPLSLFRKRVLDELGGFQTKGFAEDADVAIRIIRAGYRIEYAEQAVTETNMPVTLKGFFRQRNRFARGWVNFLKRHLKLDRTFMQIYTMPLALFNYSQAVIMALITLYNIGSGYYTYFVAQGVWLNWSVVMFLVGWLTIFGIVNWFWSVASGATPLTMFVAIGLAASLLSYPLYFIAVIRYDKRITLRHLIAITFMFPFWLVVMLTYVAHIGEWARNDQRNIWDKWTLTN